MTKREGGKITLPIQQTVFLPKEAMGVRYIDKVRATVYIERLSPAAEGVWLRGFYELDLEYQGVEGRGLCKHRIMLPLKVALPADWPGGLSCGELEAADLHAMIKRPMIKLLSPYVLEFSADMQVEYLGEQRWQEDRLNAPAPNAAASNAAARLRRGWTSDLPMPDENKPSARMESKIDRFFLGKLADKEQEQQAPRLISSRGILPDEEGVPLPHAAERQTAAPTGPPAAAESEHSLPVWKFVPAEPTVRTAANQVEKSVEKPVEKPVEKLVEKPVKTGNGKILAMDKEQIYAPPLNKNRFRSLLTAAALSRLQARGEELSAESQAALPDWQESRQAAAAAAAAAEAAEVNETIREGSAIETSENLNENLAAEASAAEAVEVASAAPEQVPEQVPETAAETTAETAAAEEVAVDKSEPVAAAAVEQTGENGDNMLPAVETMVENPQPEAQAEPVAAEPEAAGVQLVNGSGVKVRVAAAKEARRADRAVRPQENARTTGGFSMKYYVVKPGDDPMSIALKHNISLERLQAANRLPEGELTAGTMLRIPR